MFFEVKAHDVFVLVVPWPNYKVLLKDAAEELAFPAIHGVERSDVSAFERNEKISYSQTRIELFSFG
ncbi:MAG: hypothetical protein L0387_12670 [Acidobacteria bacterium]|nr:hypothetical protein [Acidobacteriota bacterium]MCI0718542.1 hypothetical protein [Acidobacteriota bacterium]